MNQNKQTAIITGASSGIGLDVTRGFLNQGWNVVMNSRSEDKLESAARALDDAGKIATVVGDIGDPDTGTQLVKAAIERFGRLDALINNAGIFGLKPFLQIEETDLDRYININLKGTYFVSQAVVSNFKAEGKGGNIVNIGTVLVSHPSASLPASAALVTKGGVHALTTSLASEFGGDNIRVNTVAPGVIRTPIYGDADIDQLGQSALLGRAGEVSELTDAVLHLAQTSYITGVMMPVDGGYVHGRA